jgi:hypothetical protein
MRKATADRILQPYRKQERHGISTTRSGTLLKKQIPVRTFNDWNETTPGFMEADLVAHCGQEAEGSYLFTLPADRYRYWLDRMSPPALAQSRGSHRRAFASTTASAFSPLGD